MKKTLAFLIIIAGFVSCNNNSSNMNTAETQDKKFESFSQTFINEFWKWNPQWALNIGNHEYDAVIEINSAEHRMQKLNQYQTWLDSLSKFDEAKLNASNRLDLKLIRNQLQSDMWYVTDFKSYEWNPAQYNVGEGFDLVMNNQKASLNEKLNTAAKRLKDVPEYYRVAMENIKKPTKEHLQLGIQQNEGSLYIFKNVLPDSLSKSTLNDADKKSLQVGIDSAMTAMNNYINYLKNFGKGLADTDYKDFRIGKDLYNKKFQFDIQSKYSAEEIYNKALERKDFIQHKMQELTAKLWTKYFDKTKMPEGNAAVEMMIQKLSLQHCNRDSFLETIQHQLPELVKFISDKNLIYIDPKKPLVVRQTPPYAEGGGAGASINDPGPYNKDGNTFYNVSLLTNYTKEQAESYLREYNNYILQILNIHEAIPGHYTQLVYANQSPSIIKSAFGNSAMIEGWAVYGERMMLEEGYNATDEMWLMYYKWHLRSVMNTILDYSIQCLNMSETDAKNLMMHEGFQQEAEASGKWKRATLTQVQLCCYFTGFTEIYDLRDEIKKKEGANFNLKKFHEKFLSYGSAPVKYIGEMMLQ